jgi:hypothetical protein
MKHLTLLLFVLMLSSKLFAQTFPEVTIMQIQYQDPDSLLLLGDRPSPYEDDTVTVTGVVMVAPYRDANPDSNVVLIAGAPAIYLQDTSETEWAGILVRHPSSTAAFNILDTGTVVKVTGWIDEFNVTTQMNAINFDASGVLGFQQTEAPVVLTLDSLAELGQFEGKVLKRRLLSVKDSFMLLMQMERRFMSVINHHTLEIMQPDLRMVQHWNMSGDTFKTVRTLVDITTLILLCRHILVT